MNSILNAPLFVLALAVAACAHAELDGSADGPPTPTESVGARMSTTYSTQLASLNQPQFCSAALDEHVVERYRFFWARSFDPPLMATLEIHESGRAFATLDEVDSMPETDGVTKLTSVWIDLCKRRADEFDEDTDEFCEEFTEVVRTSAEEGFWSQPPEQDLGDSILLDGSTWVVEGIRGSECRVVTRWSPQVHTEFFRFAMFILDQTERTIEFNEVY